MNRQRRLLSFVDGPTPRRGVAVLVRRPRRKLFTVLASALLILGMLVGGGAAQAAATQPCDLYAAGGTPCVAANQSWTATTGRQLTVSGGKCLDASGKGTSNGTAVIIWDCNGQANQQWSLRTS